MAGTETTTFRRIVSDGERRVFEWETSLHDRGSERYLSEERERVLSDAFTEDERFRNMVLASLVLPGASHAELWAAYRTCGYSMGGPVKRLVTDPGFSPDRRVLAGVDADLKRLADDATDRTRMGSVWAFRALIAWMLGDVDGARTRVGTALYLTPGDELACIVMMMLRMGVAVGGRSVMPVTVGD